MKQNLTKAAATNWTRILTKHEVNDVAIDSQGTIYITKPDGTLHYSVNGTVYIRIPLPPNRYSSTVTEIITITYEATRIAVSPLDYMPWVIITKTDERIDKQTNLRSISITNHLYHLQQPGNRWIERGNAPDPVDVAFTANGMIFVTSATPPYSVFSTDQNPATPFFQRSNTDGSSRISAGANDILWIVKRDGTVWKNAIGLKFSQVSGHAGMLDVGASLSGEVMGLVEQKKSLFGQVIYNGAIWRSNDHGNTFSKDSSKRDFQNVAVSSSNILYAVGLNGELWKCQ